MDKETKQQEMTAYRFRRRHLTTEKDIRIRFHYLFHDLFPMPPKIR